MRGLPNNFATKQDYINSLQLYPEQTKAALRALVADRFIWVRGAKLENAEDGVNDKTHRVMELTEGDDAGFYQYEYQENPNARLFKLGFTVADVEALL